jgi:hypothetical protein
MSLVGPRPIVRDESINYGAAQTSISAGAWQGTAPSLTPGSCAACISA